MSWFKSEAINRPIKNVYGGNTDGKYVRHIKKGVRPHISLCCVYSDVAWNMLQLLFFSVLM